MSNFRRSTKSQLRGIYDSLVDPMSRGRFYQEHQFTKASLEKCLSELDWLREVRPAHSTKRFLVRDGEFSVPKGFDLVTEGNKQKLLRLITRNPGKNRNWLFLHCRGCWAENAACLHQLVLEGELFWVEFAKRRAGGYPSRRYYPKGHTEEGMRGTRLSPDYRQKPVKDRKRYKRGKRRAFIQCPKGTTIQVGTRYFKHLMKYHNDEVLHLADVLAWLFEGQRVRYGEFARVASRKLYYLSKENGWRRVRKGSWVRESKLPENNGGLYQ